MAPRDASAPGLANALRAHVHALHTRAERSGIISDILNGTAGLAAYLLLLRNLLPCYEAMEAALERRAGRPLLDCIARRELYRSSAILADLNRLAANWQTDLPLLPVSRAYASCTAEAGDGDGSRLIAHAYTRYLGDLNGGAIILRRLQPEIPGGQLHFHAFPELRDLPGFKAEYRAAFNTAGAALAVWQPVLNEAAVSFEHNIAVANAARAAHRNRTAAAKRP